MENKYYLILDIGGTKTTGAVFTEEGSPVKDVFLTAPSVTYEGKDAVFRNTVEVGRRTLEQAGVDPASIIGVGAAAPGPLDYRTGYIIDVPMMGWKDFPLGDLLQKEFGAPVRIDNDGNLGALAEQRVGVARGENSVLYMTVSTGCGGGIVLGGKIYRGRSGGAGEFGHMSIDYNGIPCPCGSRGCLELYASGTAMNRRMRSDCEKKIPSSLFTGIGYDPDRISGALLGKAAKDGDAYALEFFRQEGRYLGAGLANLFNLFDPDVIVLGGGVTKSAEFFEEEMLAEVNRRSCLPVARERIRFSELNDRVTLYGAYFLINDYLLEEGGAGRERKE